MHQEIEAHTQHITALTREAAPELVQAYGIGLDTAAEMLITCGDNGTRLHSEAAFAKMCGVCPLPASSGKTQHRLNRGGNRQANAALFRVVIVRMRGHEPTKAYVARRTAQGLSNRSCSLIVGYGSIRESMISVQSPLSSSCQQMILSLKLKLGKFWMRSPSFHLSNASP